MAAEATSGIPPPPQQSSGYFDAHFLLLGNLVVVLLACRSLPSLGRSFTTSARHFNGINHQVSIFLVGDHTVLFIEPTASGVSDQISNRIYYAGSKLRLNNARYLVRIVFGG